MLQNPTPSCMCLAYRPHTYEALLQSLPAPSPSVMQLQTQPSEESTPHFLELEGHDGTCSLGPQNRVGVFLEFLFLELRLGRL